MTVNELSIVSHTRQRALVTRLKMSQETGICRVPVRLSYYFLVRESRRKFPLSVSISYPNLNIIVCHRIRFNASQARTMDQTKQRCRCAMHCVTICVCVAIDNNEMEQAFMRRNFSEILKQFFVYYNHPRS